MGWKCAAQIQLKTWGCSFSPVPRSEAHHIPPFPEMPLNQQRRLENINFSFSFFFKHKFFFLAREAGLERTILSREKLKCCLTPLGCAKKKKVLPGGSLSPPQLCAPPAQPSPALCRGGDIPRGRRDRGPALPLCPRLPAKELWHSAGR